MLMTRTELEEVTRQWISLWNAPTDWELFDKLHADDFEDHSPVDRPTDKQAYAGDLRAFMAVFPDLVIRVEDMVVDEAAQRVAVRWSAVGTNRLKFLGIGPTHKATPIKGIEIIEMRAGRIVKRWGEWDISGHIEA